MSIDNTQPAVLTEAAEAVLGMDKPTDPDAEKENRQLRHWVVRCLIGTMSVAFLMVVIAIIYAFVFQQREMEQTVAGEFLSIFGEVLKIMLAPPGGN